MHEIDIPLASGEQTLGLHYPADGTPHASLVLAHGAGAGQRHPFMVAVAVGLAARGVDVLTFDFPYMTRRKPAPDRPPVLEECFRAAVAAARALPAAAGLPLFIGGKSMGGRMATHLAAQGASVAGVVCFGYPLHPPGRADQLRTAHWPAIAAPLLIVQGERDTFGTPDELRAHLPAVTVPVTLHVVGGGDHSLTVRGRKSGATLEPVLDRVVEWMAGATGRRQGP